MFGVEDFCAGVGELLKDEKVRVELLVAVNHEGPEDHQEVWQSGDLGDEVKHGLNPSFIDLID